MCAFDVYSSSKDVILLIHTFKKESHFNLYEDNLQEEASNTNILGHSTTAANNTHFLNVLLTTILKNVFCKSYLDQTKAIRLLRLLSNM